MLAPSPRRPIVLRTRRPWRRLVPAIRGLAARGIREWEIASRLRISPRRVKLGLSEGAGIWSPEEWRRLCAAAAAEVGR